MNYWEIPSFGKRYNALRMLKNKRVETNGQYTIENIVDRLSKTNPGLITERVLREILQDVFREDIKRDLMMEVLIKDLGMTKDEFWRREAPPKAKPAKPVMTAPTVVMKQETPKVVTAAPIQTQKPKPAEKSEPVKGKKKLKITTHIADYSFIIVFENGKIDIYEDSERNAKLKGAIWIPPADLKQGKNLSPRSIEVNVEL